VAPLISVVITNYNYAGYVSQAIESALDQTYENLEIIVIDDGSTDASRGIIEGYAHNSQIVFVSQENQGANLTRNKGLAMAHGEYIFFLDSDNWLDPDHLEKLVSVAQEGDADVVYTDLQYFGDADTLYRVPQFDIDTLKATNFIDTASLVRKESIGDNRFDPELNRKFLQDWDFFLGLALKGARIVKAEDVSVNYRIHARQRHNPGETMEKLDEYAEVYTFIVDKYRGLYPEQFGGHVQWSNQTVVRMLELRKETLHRDKQIEALRWEVGNYQKQTQEILDSQSYKLGHILGTPIRAWRRILGKTG